MLSGYAITYPPPNATLSGVVNILGTATLPNFQFYKVEYGFGTRPTEWISIEGVAREPVTDGVLVTWDTRALPAGSYVLRLTLVDITANYPPPFEVQVRIGNPPN